MARYSLSTSDRRAMMRTSLVSKFGLIVVAADIILLLHVVHAETWIAAIQSWSIGGTEENGG